MNYLYAVKSVRDDGIRSRFFAPSDFDALEYVLSLFSSADERLRNSFLFRDPKDFKICRLGFFDSDSDYVTCSVDLFGVVDVFNFCCDRGFDGRYKVFDILNEWGTLTLWSDRWNSVLKERSSLEDAKTSQVSSPTHRSESSFEPDHPRCGDSEATAIDYDSPVAPPFSGSKDYEDDSSVAPPFSGSKDY